MNVICRRRRCYSVSIFFDSAPAPIATRIFQDDNVFRSMIRLRNPYPYQIALISTHFMGADRRARAGASRGAMPQKQHEDHRASCTTPPRSCSGPRRYAPHSRRWAKAACFCPSAALRVASGGSTPKRNPRLTGRQMRCGQRGTFQCNLVLDKPSSYPISWDRLNHPLKYRHHRRHRYRHR